MAMNDRVVEQIKASFKSDDWAEVRRLLNENPEVKARINEPIGPFDSPAVSNVRSREMLDVMLEAGADVNAKSRWWAGGFGLLHLADPELARYAIERGARVDVHAAARLGMLEVLQELVAADPEAVHERGGDGQTPLHFASTVEIAAFLLDLGAEIDALDVDHESTPAQYMTDHRHEVASYLISRGCKTDLLMASAVGDIDVVRMTLDRDPESIRMRVSDEYFTMVGGKTGGTIYQWTLGWYVSAHQVARKFGHGEVLQMLLAKSPPDVLLIDACWSDDAESVRALLDRDPAIAGTLRDEDRRQIAHAAHNNQTKSVRLFLEAGLPISATSQHQATALHWAAFHGNLAMMRTLLSYGPSLERKDADFHATPLGWAVYGSENGWNAATGDYAGCVEALIDAGARAPDALAGSPEVREILRRI